MLKITIEILSSPAYSFFNSSVHFKLEKTEEIPKITDILKCRINDKFQVVDLNPIKLAV
ncbi:hypothetical protein [Candidatus Rhabdochlamydia oedothoracis]|uniref:hypothetical protein n=1 Tax=Candidatus Rhabdochlamydia oedothoracis TaxID=2720720 RepID=UPI001C64FD77|nr:hypothetical protein [Candidatus Rhabdochlamydia oedothoracis]